MDRWTNGPMNQWTHGPIDQWSNRPRDQWTNGLMEQWTMDQWTNGPMDQWTNGPMDNRPMDQWANWPTDQWTNGTLDHWNIGTLEYWNIGTFEHWNTGTLENWKIGTLEHSAFNQHLVTSIALILFERLGVTLVTSIASRENLKKLGLYDDIKERSRFETWVQRSTSPADLFWINVSLVMSLRQKLQSSSRWKLKQLANSHRYIHFHLHR